MAPVLRILRVIDGISRTVGLVAMALVLMLMVVMLTEVFARYVMLRPTVWVFDVTFMTNGALFLLAAAHTMRYGGHIRIDFLSTQLPIRVQHLVNFAFFLLLFLPAFGMLSHATILRAYASFETGRREMASAWGPVVWPYQGALALGCAVLWLQCLAETVRYGIGIAHPDKVSPPGRSEAVQDVKALP